MVFGRFSRVLRRLKVKIDAAAESSAYRVMPKVQRTTHELMASETHLNGPAASAEYEVLKYFVAAYSSDSPPPLLVFGDSVSIRVASDDQSLAPLGDILSARCQDDVCLISGSGYHAGIFEQFGTVLATLPVRPRLAVLPINLRSFSPVWDLNPLYQFHPEIELLSTFNFNKPEYGLRSESSCTKSEIRLTPWLPGFGKIATLGDFLDITAKRPESGSDEWLYRLKTIFQCHYMLPVFVTHRKIQNLKQTIRLMNKLGVAVYCYFTPINYEAGLKYCGAPFVTAVKKNISVIQQEIKSTAAAGSSGVDAWLFRLDNFAFQLTSDIFFTRHNATEHLRFEGRDFIARRITEAWHSLLKSGAC